MDNQHIVIHRPIAGDARHQWDFYLDGEEIKLHSYQLQQYSHKTAQFDICTHYLEGGSCTQDRLNVPMPVDVVREVQQDFIIDTPTGTPMPVCVGPRYDAVSDLLADNPNLAVSVFNYLADRDKNIRPRFTALGSSK